MKRFKNNLGFTLVELLIVMAMMALITTVMLANFKNGDKFKKVQLSADAMVNIVRLGQNYSLSGRQIQQSQNPVSGSRCPTDTSVNRYLIEVNPANNTISLLAEDNCSATFLTDRYTLPTGVRFAPGGITLVSCYVGNCPLTSTPANVRVAFTPPFGTMSAASFNETPAPFRSLTVRIESADSVRFKDVVIDGISGQIGY